MGLQRLRLISPTNVDSPRRLGLSYPLRGHSIALQLGDVPMNRYSLRGLYWSVVSILMAAIAFSSTADATALDSERVLEKLAALEARISALETENRAVRKEAAEAQAQMRKVTDQRHRLSNAAVSNEPMSALAYQGHSPVPNSLGWTGIYWGASAGGAVTRSNVASSQQDTNGPTFGIDVTGRSAAQGAGGLVDVFTGWNSRISNIVIGGQIEATSANLNFSSTGAKQYRYFDANGFTGQTGAADFRPQVASRWMASALLRAGVLLNEQTLVYAIGGWTGAQFEARNVTDNPFYQPVESFWASGWTAGAGIERKLDSNWSVRAEYRYTSFGSVRTTDQFSFQLSNLPSSASQRQTQYDQSMQSGRVGFAYSFNPLQ